MEIKIVFGRTGCRNKALSGVTGVWLLGWGPGGAGGWRCVFSESPILMAACWREAAAPGGAVTA